MPLSALALAAIAFVPLDDRPVTAQLPVLLGRIAGVAVTTPPRAMLGHVLEPGRPDEIVVWLNREAAARRPGAIVVSTDMLAYGGLLASRVPGTSYADARSRLMELAHLRAEYPQMWIGAFGTIMRLAPTGIPAGTPYFAAYPQWTYLQEYANLHDPPTAGEAARAARLRELIGEPLLDAYLATRARDLAIDRLLLSFAARGTLDRLVLGQDDAGPVGLHVREVAQLQSDLAADPAAGASIEPGADELGMALVAHALAVKARWTPRVAVRYSMPGAGAYQDPIEYAPIAAAIGSLVAACGGVIDDAAPQIVLYVRVPGTTPQADDATVAAMESDAAAGRSVALADLSFLASYRDQAAFARRILAEGVASKLDAYASWNTNANTVGTALAEAVAAGAGRRMGTYDALAHRTMTFIRFLDDYAYHDEVRPALNDELAAAGIADHTLLPAEAAAQASQRDRALLWNDALPILAQLDPGYHIAAISIGLPWGRTFETAIDAAIAPNL